MAHKLYSANGEVQYNINEYTVDTPEDLKKLPKNCEMGSSAFCLSNGAVYIKDGNGNWREI